MIADNMWERIHDVFEQALDLEPGARDVFLDEACGADHELLHRVRMLLGAHDALEEDQSGTIGLPHTLDPRLTSALLEDVPEDLEVGTMVGRYRVVRRTASGGMGVVYLADDPRLGRPVALKVLPRWRTADAEMNRRLEEEARAASALDHPNIATIYEIGESDEGRLFIAMAWYEGGTLRERLGGKALPVETAVDIARQVAEGLAAAHRRGIVHRDIKPENIIFGRGNRAVIVDFGIASAVRFGTPGSRTPGTAAYMSPEQARGEVPDDRADIWALGMVLYEMLAGSRPTTSEAESSHHPTPPARIPDLGPEVSPRLTEIVHQCLEEELERRCPSADFLVKALGEVAGGEQEESRTPIRRAAPAIATYVVTASLVFLGAGSIADHFFLPGWFSPAVLVLLVVGLPVTAATALVSRGPAHSRWAGLNGLIDLLTWRRTVAGGFFGFALVVLAAAAMVMGGIPRITEARGGLTGSAGERPWVVLSDFEASEGAEDLAVAAREALAVDLSQSGSVSVFGRIQISSVLRRMGRPPNEVVDLDVALEIAERVGAGAVIAGSVSRVGGQYVLFGRAIDPESGEEIFAVRTASGGNRLLGAVERLSHEMRHRLGEERAQIRLSRPLPDVSTTSLEALRLYAAAEERLMRQDFRRASAFAEEAIRIDPGFAMAHRLAAAAAVPQLSYGRSLFHTTRAFELRERLTERERRHVEAIYYLNGSFEPARGVEAYRLLLERFPDDVRAWHNLGAALHSWMDDSEGAYEAQLRYIELDHFAGFATANAAYLAAILGRAEKADSLAQLTVELGTEDFDNRWRMARAFGEGDIHELATICAALLDSPVSPGAKANDDEICGSMDVAAGRVALGQERLEAATEEYLLAGRHRNVAHAAHGLAVGDALRGDRDRAAARLLAVVESIEAEVFIEPDRFITRTNLQVHAALLGRPDVVAQIGLAYPPHDEPAHWFVRFAESLVLAATAVNSGDGEAALRALDEGKTDGLMPIGWRVWDALLRGLAHEIEGEYRDAAVHLLRAAEPGYLALPYLAKNRVMLPYALEALERVERAAGNLDAATEARNRHDRLWAMADPGIGRQLR